MIDITNSTSYSIDILSAQKYIKQMLRYLKVNISSDISILFVDSKEMTIQHLKWMKEDGPTDVMSFPMDDILLGSKESKKHAILGDIIICPEVALNDARKQSINPAKHLVFLMAHGVLHLLGQDHQEKDKRSQMQKREQGIMKSLRTVKKI